MTCEETALEDDLSQQKMSAKSKKMLDEVLHFVDSSKGLKCKVSPIGKVEINQSVDGKTFSFYLDILDEVLHRSDADGNAFIQINFQSGMKVLFTDTLVGFKPSEVVGLDMAKIPKVVTTPDLVSVFEAIEESLSSDQSPEHEIDILKRVYQAILLGGEVAGFDLAFEKKWLSRLTSSAFRASA